MVNLLKNLLILMFVSALWGCGDTPVDSAMTEKWVSEVTLFSNCTQMSDYLSRYRNNTNYGSGNPVSVAPAGSGSARQHYSNQVEGVIEGDILQTGPNYFYFVRGNSMEVVDRNSLAVVRSIPIDGSFNNELLLSGDKLVLFGSHSQSMGAMVKIFDTRDDFRVVYQQELAGSMIDYRFVEDKLILVTQQYDFLSSSSQDCSNIYRPNWENGSSQLTYVHQIVFPPAQSGDQFRVKSTGFLGSSDFIYMTQDELFLFANGIYANFRSIRLQTEGAKLMGAHRFEGVLKDRYSVLKKDASLFLATTTFDNQHRIRSNRLIAFNEIKGSKDYGYHLASMSSSFGEKEDIRAVMYRGDYAYVVTFEKTDPLFVLEIADPQNIRILSETKVPGFSTQLKPFSPTVLAGLGYDADPQEGFSWFTGLKVSLFDVQNLLQPSEISTLVWGDRGSYSEATYEPKALFVFEPENLLMFPAVIRKNSENQGAPDFGSRLEFAGALILQREGPSILELGRISHEEWRVAQCGDDSVPHMIWWDQENQSTDIQRIFILDGDFYSFSRFGVKRNDRRSLATKQQTQFAPTPLQCPGLVLPVSI